jgi:hypothetical protein
MERTLILAEPEPEDILLTREMQTPWYDPNLFGTIDLSPPLPVVSIGRPVIWPLSNIYAPEKMPLALQSRLDVADFYLINLFCSFRPDPMKSCIEWAHFEIRFLPDNSGRQPLTLDLYPLLISQEGKRQTKVTLAPTLKFQEVEGELGSLEWGREYPEIHPIIIGAGLGEPNASWDFATVQGSDSVAGAKWMFLLIEAPKGMSSGQASLNLKARVKMLDTNWPEYVWSLVRGSTGEEVVVSLWKWGRESR